MDNKTKVIFILREIMLILLIVFFFVFNTTTKTHCGDCLFMIDEEGYSAVEFFDMYIDKCFVKSNPLLNISDTFIPE